METKRLEALSRQPMHVAALGWVDGKCFTARANYVRLEVRDEAGQLRLEHDTWRTDDWLLREMRFAGAHLISAIGDIFASGLRIWDVKRSVEASRVDGSWQHEGDVVLWADPVQPRALVRYRAGVAMLDAAAFAFTRAASCDPDASSVTYDPLLDRLASGEGFGPAQLTLHEFGRRVLRTCSLGEGEVEDLLFARNGCYLAVKQVGGTVVVRDTETLEVRWESTSERILAASPCGRWLALDRALVDLHSFSAVPLPPADGALFDPRRGELVLADRKHTWRVPLP
ncbi:hypothetical protein [Myxococcus sp. Y35]|uniref:hypothetical protein n=1 Tax=Pseudomyxococcus flavus TaxID=3115648 RepID=UPI003CFB471C